MGTGRVLPGIHALSVDLVLLRRGQSTSLSSSLVYSVSLAT